MRRSAELLFQVVMVVLGITFMSWGMGMNNEVKCVVQVEFPISPNGGP